MRESGFRETPKVDPIERAVPGGPPRPLQRLHLRLYSLPEIARLIARAARLIARAARLIARAARLEDAKARFQVAQASLSARWFYENPVPAAGTVLPRR
jgi:hypothetical protein